MRLVLANVLVVLLLFGALEAGVRILIPEIGPLGTDAGLLQDSVFQDRRGLRPGATGTSNGARFEVDADGYIVYSAAAEDDAPAWLFLGDSVTMGIGVEPDSTFAGRLAAATPVRVLNPSVVGYSLSDYSILLDHHLGRSTDLDLERVTVFWCLNDIYGSEVGGRSPGAGLRRVSGRLLGVARRELRSYQWLKNLVTDRPRAYFEFDAGHYREPLVEAAADRLRDMHHKAANRGVALDIVLLPYEYQLRSRSASAFEPQRAFQRTLERRGVQVFDVAPHLLSAAADPSTLYLYGDGIHFSHAGHAAVAAFVGGTKDSSRTARLRQKDHYPRPATSAHSTRASADQADANAIVGSGSKGLE